MKSKETFELRRERSRLEKYVAREGKKPDVVVLRDDRLAPEFAFLYQEQEIFWIGISPANRKYRVQGKKKAQRADRLLKQGIEVHRWRNFSSGALRMARLGQAEARGLGSVTLLFVEDTEKERCVLCVVPGNVDEWAALRRLQKASSDGEDLTSGEKTMELIDHLIELKDRLVRIALVLVVCGAASFVFANRVFDWILAPLSDAIKNYQTQYGLEYEIIATEPTTMISLFMKISLFSGAVFAMPFILFQVLRFVLPALTADEERELWSTIPLATLLFLGGAAFCYYVMVPAAIPFLLGFGWTFLGGETVAQKWQVDKYLPFFLNLVFWIGVSFETPLIMRLMAKLRVVNHKQFLAAWRFAVVAIGVLAAFITPTPDPFNMSLVMAPLLALYFVGIFMAWLARPKDEQGSTQASAT